ncbi:uncharacterized protein LOC111313328 [Durio zibethinus]|uniref:Uncharacterized protein LOC111313328 n=1 Tax=Durio zibethinus TaxID=66656 RepID=A0A6P6AXS7_DURZI|nr:uncharacterized protein LOC111313328 [Durio zibethinus]
MLAPIHLPTLSLSLSLSLSLTRAHTLNPLQKGHYQVVLLSQTIEEPQGWRGAEMSMESVARASQTLGSGPNGQQARNWCGHFQMPLHYPRYNKADYEAMPEWKLDCLLKEYGLPISGDVEQKRKFAMGAFLWARQTSY